MVLYSVYRNSEMGYICKEGHNHGCSNFEVACPPEEEDAMLAEFDTLDRKPWLVVNNEFVRDVSKTSTKSKTTETESGE